MLYSESGNRWAFVVDKGCFPQNSFRDVVNGIYSIVSSRQVIKVAKQEVKVHDLIQELVEPTSEKQGNPEEDLIHDDTFYLEMAAFEFQDTDFFVPTHRFVEKVDPDHFSAIFGPNFGTTETLYQFPGVAASEFRGLMKYLYPLNVQDSADELTVDDWIAILKLSTKWRMLALREEAIQKLNNNNKNGLSAIMKVQLGKECKITEWVRSGYIALVERQEHFTEADVIAIGLESVAKLCELREQGYAGEWDTYCNRLTLEAHGTSNLIADKISRISAVDHLNYDDDNLVTAILDAQSLGNRRLMLDAWGRMARRVESLTLEEVESLTLGIAIMMWEVRLETRKAAWSLVQEYGVKCNVKPLGISQSIVSTFASELEDIEVQALDYALSKPDSNAEDEEEIPDSALEPMPPKNSTALFEQSLALRKRVVELEQLLNENVDTTLNRQLRKDLRRCRLSAQKWCTLATVSGTPQSTLDVNAPDVIALPRTLEDRLTELILKNASKLTMDGRGTGPHTWGFMKSYVLGFIERYHFEYWLIEQSKVIHIILPVSKS